MSYAKQSTIEVIVPYGNPSGSLHFRFQNDYKTFCGRVCEGWSDADTPFVSALDSSYACKRCVNAALK